MADSHDLEVARAVRDALRPVADFPKPGIRFLDISPVLGNAALYRRATEAMAAPFRDARVTHVAGIESRGFLFGAPIAQHLGAGFVPLRKPGKLPYHTSRIEYALEYGNDALEMHRDACDARARVLLVDDVLATGGTAGAACALVETSGARVVGCAFLLQIAALGGVGRLTDRDVRCLVTV